MHQEHFVHLALSVVDDLDLEDHPDLKHIQCDSAPAALSPIVAVSGSQFQAVLSPELCGVGVDETLRLEKIRSTQ